MNAHSNDVIYMLFPSRISSMLGLFIFFSYFKISSTKAELASLWVLLN